MIRFLELNEKPNNDWRITLAFLPDLTSAKFEWVLSKVERLIWILVGEQVSKVLNDHIPSNGVI